MSRRFWIAVGLALSGCGERAEPRQNPVARPAAAPPAGVADPSALAPPEATIWERIDLSAAWAARSGYSQSYLRGSVEVPRGTGLAFEIEKTRRASGGAASTIRFEGRALSVSVSGTAKRDPRGPRTLAAFIEANQIRPDEIYDSCENQHGFALLYVDQERGTVSEHLGALPPVGTLTLRGQYGNVSCRSLPDPQVSHAERALHICCSFEP